MSAGVPFRPAYWLESALAMSDGIVVGVCQVQLSKRFDEKRLEQANQQCFDRHPNLRVNIDMKASPPQLHFVPTPFSPPEYIELTSDDEWKQIVHRELNTPFPLGVDKPGFLKLLVLYGGEGTHRPDYLLLKYHHAIADGMSGMIILNTILSYYFESNPFSNELPTLPDSDTLAFPTTTSDDERKIEQQRQALLAHRRQWTPTIPYEVTSEANSELYCSGTADNLSKLLQRCRQEKITIGSVLAAASYFVSADIGREKW
jgi:hypothetical protein